jgi:hypothetical protein
MQIRFSECTVKRLRELGNVCAENGENLILILDKEAIKKEANIEDPGEEDISISKDYFRIPDAVLYLSPSGSLRIMKAGN